MARRNVSFVVGAVGVRTGETAGEELRQVCQGEERMHFDVRTSSETLMVMPPTALSVQRYNVVNKIYPRTCYFTSISLLVETAGPASSRQ
jgi:hypothetical protein